MGSHMENMWFVSLIINIAIIDNQVEKLKMNKKKKYL